jgi:hypothetical protein
MGHISIISNINFIYYWCETKIQQFLPQMFFLEAKLTHQIGTKDNRTRDLKRNTLPDPKSIPLDQCKWVHPQMLVYITSCNVYALSFGQRNPPPNNTIRFFIQ